MCVWGGGGGGANWPDQAFSHVLISLWDLRS